MEGAPTETPIIRNDLPQKMSEEPLTFPVQESQPIFTQPITEEETLPEDDFCDAGKSLEDHESDRHLSDSKKSQGPVQESTLIVKPFNRSHCIWRPVSISRREKIKKLVDDSEVNRVGNLIYRPTKDFLIAGGHAGNEVFLGLRNDGTEVSIKKTSKHKCEMLENEEEFLRIPKLDRASILRYVDATEDDKYKYLAVQLYEYNLKEYLELNNTNMDRVKIVENILKVLNVLHHNNPPILHGAITEQSVVIDVTGEAKVADFTQSKYLVFKQTTENEEEKPWNMPLRDEREIQNKLGDDIQMTGKLLFYVLSGGQHHSAETLDQVEDILEQDLIQRMTNEDTQKRLKIKECLQHPIFWTHKRRDEYLRRFSNKLDKNTEKGKGKKKQPDPDLISSVEKYDRRGSLKNWKAKFPIELKMMESYKSYNNDVFGLLRFNRNLCEHHAEKNVNVTSMFPDLFGCMYKLAESQGWNLEPPLQDVFLFTNG